MAPRIAVRGVKVVRRVPEILRLCHEKRVLHLGCADAPYTLRRGEELLHRKLSRVTETDQLWGIDIDQHGVSILREMGFENVLVGDCESLASALRDRHFDVVLAGEILEHVENPGRFLRSVAAVMAERTELLLTTVNAFSLKGALHSLLREEKVHPDHNFYFSHETLKQLLHKCGLTCRSVYYYQEVEGRGPSGLADRIMAVVARISPLWSDGLIVRATR